MNNIQELHKDLDSQQKLLDKKHKALQELEPKLASFPKDLSLSFGGYGEWSTIDFDYPGRAEVIELVTFLKAGKWDKEPSASGGKIDYKNHTLVSMPLRIYAAEPPASCKVVEVDELIPAQPARVVKVKTLVCKEHLLTPTV